MSRKSDLSVACLIDGDIVRQIETADAADSRAIYDLSVVQALRRSYRDVKLVRAVEGSARSMDELVQLRPDVVFNLAFSAHPFEASWAACLDILRIPYTGSGPLGIAIANDKIRSRQVLRSASIRVPRFIELVPGRRIAIDLTPPLIVKPVSLAGCTGIYADSVVTTPKDVAKLAKRIWRRFGQSAVCDEFVVGREFRIGILEASSGVFGAVGITEWHFGKAIPGWGIKTEAIVNNHTVRQARDVSRRRAVLSRRKSDELTAIARNATTAIDVRGYATVDVRVDLLGRVTVLEVNANPGLWSGSSIWGKPNFDSNIRKIVDAALRRGSTIQ
jgi:D-alanine-D-alanine ligase